MTFGTSCRVVGSGTSASMITPNVDCICVCLYSWFSTTRGIASRLSSITMRMPSRSRLVAQVADALELLVAHQLGDVLDRACALLTWYGISVTTICDLFDDSFSSITARARMTMRPRPVSW